MNARRIFKIISGGLVAAATLVEMRSISQSHNDLVAMQSPYQQQRSLFTWTKRLFERFPNLTNVQAESAFPRDNIKPWDWNWDSRQSQPDGGSKAHVIWGDKRGSVKGSGSRHLLFIRHGQYHYADSDKDCHLTQLGREQLNFTGARLKQLNLPYSILYYSTMTRAIESTEEIMRYLPDVPVEPTDGLREGAPFPLEPPLENYRPTEEELDEDGSRIEKAFRNYIHRPSSDQNKDSYEIFVCHANVIRYFVCRALQIPPEAWIRFSLDHGSITWIVVRPSGRVTLRWLGSSGHMPPEKISIS
ncbi:Serine/threonine-protein phosphatase PGAM5 mitochondrial [Fasciolopsis buskii]|uniref:Serine/threonine-protein phosphatase PGAM5, mitochondrial n=1 Tax=Fasciolopsis buskii TaxID=27845 RepID=A0A8E0S3N4_9TREM|nr:Serine/threonine-protein phosphatase PGAM5 mitochondrial [Fasciolopsis buski]